MITPEQRELRRKYIGSSEAAAVLGLDPRRSASDIWLEKTGRLEPDEGNEHTERGNLLEPVVLEWDARQCGIAFQRSVMRVHPNGTCATNYDGISAPELGVIQEAKTTVLVEEWGDQGTDAVPERVLAQCHMGFACAGEAYRLARVPVLMPGYRSFDFRLYLVERDNALAEAVAEKCHEFMERHVRKDIPPEDFRPSVEIVKRLRRTPGKSIQLPDLPAQLYELAKAKAKAAGEELERAKADLLAAMGDAEAAECSRGTYTYLETKRAGYVVGATSFRQLRFKAHK